MASLAKRGQGTRPSPVSTARADANLQAPQTSGNPWEAVLSPRQDDSKSSKDSRTARMCQSPTTAARALRVRREKARLKEEEAAAAEAAEMKAKPWLRNRQKPKSKTSDNARATRRTSGTSSKQRRSKISQRSSAAMQNGSTRTSARTSARSSAASRRGNPTRARGTAVSSGRRGHSAGSKRALASKKGRAEVTTKSSRTKLRKLRAEAEAQEEIRAVIDKVTVQFERMMETPACEVSTEASAAARRAASAKGPPSAKASLACNLSDTGGPHDSVDLEATRVELRVDEQAVDREEQELQRRAAALQADMKRLRQRKLKLHLAQYEHDLQVQMRAELRKFTKNSLSEVQKRRQMLQKRTEEQLQALQTFGADLKRKIDRLLSMQKQVEEKRLALEAAYRTGLENLEAAHVSDVDRKKAALDKVVRAKLLEAAQAEGWALEVEPEAASTAGSATGESDPDSVGADS